MSFKLKPFYVDNTVPVFKVPMEKNVYGKANNDTSSNSGFNISINQNINDTPTFMKVVEHENLHVEQMAKGDMDYDDEYVYWKGQKIPRANMAEGAHDLPWEDEVYDKTDVDMSFKMREGSGNHPAFANLSERQLIKSANAMASPLHNNQDPPKGSEIPYSGSKKALEQKADLAKLGKEREVKLNPGDPGYGDKELGIKKYTSYYKAKTPEQKKKGNEFWASLTPEQQQKIRDEKSRYTKEPIKIDPIGIKPIPIKSTVTPRKIEKIPELEVPDPGDKTRIKTKREIKRESLSMGVPETQKYRYGIGLRKDAYGRKKPSKILTAVLGDKTTMSDEGRAHYEKELAKRKEQKHYNRKQNKWLSSDEKTADYRGEYNKPSNTKVTRTSTTTEEPVGNMRKPVKGYYYIRKTNR